MNQVDRDGVGMVILRQICALLVPATLLAAAAFAVGVLLTFVNHPPEQSPTISNLVLVYVYAVLVGVVLVRVLMPRYLVNGIDRAGYARQALVTASMLSLFCTLLVSGLLLLERVVYERLAVPQHGALAGTEISLAQLPMLLLFWFLVGAGVGAAVQRWGARGVLAFPIAMVGAAMGVTPPFFAGFPTEETVLPTPLEWAGMTADLFLAGLAVWLLIRDIPVRQADLR